MQEVLAISLQAMHQDMQRLDHIGNNLANALTPGYKRQVVSSQPLSMVGSAPGGTVSGTFSTVVNRLSGQTAALAAPAGFAPALTASPLLIQADTHPGTLKATGQSLDVAIAGPGYFEVSTDNGPAYTRQGNFHVDARGRLVTAQGHPVMGKGGDIYLTNPNPVIDAAGNVYASQEGAAPPSALAAGRRAPAEGLGQNQAAAQLKVVQVDDARQLQRLGDGLLTMGDSGSGSSLMKDADIQVRQGFLENSNVSAMQEMVQLLQTMRHFESMQKVALGYDDMTGQAIRKLGDLS